MRRYLYSTALGLLALLVASVSAGAANNASDQKRVSLTAGFLAAPGIDGHLFVGMSEGFWAKQGISFKPIKFNTGPQEAQALVGGSLDVALIGGATPIFNCSGAIRTFLWNAVEPFSSDIWARPGIRSVRDLKGARVATSVGTTAHMLLYVALRDAGLSIDDVRLVNSDMPTVVNSFIAGAVDAIASFQNFNPRIRQARPDAIHVATAKDYDPKVTTMGGWATTPDFAAKNPSLLKRIVAGWLDTNKFITKSPKASKEIIYAAENNVAPLPRSEWEEIQWPIVQFQTNASWNNKLWKKGGGRTVEAIQGNLVEGFKAVGAIPSCPPTSQWLKPSRDLFLQGYKTWLKKQPSARR